jgi:PTS system nitrogen regulatory IIA component
MIYLKNYVLKDKIHFLDAKDKSEVLEKMIMSLEPIDCIKNFHAFKKAVFEREDILSTGIGNGVAIPHVKMKEIDQFFISIGILQQGVNWDSIDNNPVHLVFLIGGPDNHDVYLRILSKLFLIIKNKNIRENMLSCENAQEIVQIFEKY